MINQASTKVIDILSAVLIKNSLVTAFAFVGLTVWLSYWVSDKFTAGHVHGSAIAIALGLLLAYLGGISTGGSKGIADIEILAGVGIMGGAMLRDLDKLLMEETGLPVIVAEDPLTCVVRGSGRALEEMERNSTVFTND